jgi:hypothetical protein
MEKTGLFLPWRLTYLTRVNQVLMEQIGKEVFKKNIRGRKLAVC